jgi:hypothetical protein
MDETGKPLSVDFRAHLRLFAFYIYNCSFDDEFFDKFIPEYHSALETKSKLFGQLFAVFITHLEVSLEADLNSNSAAVHQAQQRAAQVLIKHLSPEYEIIPPLSQSEIQIEGSKEEWKDEIKRFALDFGLGVLEPSVLGDIDYLPQTWDYEQIFAVFSNVLRIDRNGKPTNSDWARYRAAQRIRMYIDHPYSAIPPFQDWEMELHL